MSKPYIHAVSSAKKFGGVFSDYIELHSFMDSSKGAVPSNLHRALTHHSWFLSNILERIKFKNSHESADGFFPTIINSDGKHISVRDLGEQHILEDFRGRFIPTAQDYLQEMEFKDWMNNGMSGYPSSYQKINQDKESDITETKIKLFQKGNVHYDGSNISLPETEPKVRPISPGLID